MYITNKHNSVCPDIFARLQHQHRSNVRCVYVKSYRAVPYIPSHPDVYGCVLFYYLLTIRTYILMINIVSRPIETNNTHT